MSSCSSSSWRSAASASSAAPIARSASFCCNASDVSPMSAPSAAKRSLSSVLALSERFGSTCPSSCSFGGLPRPRRPNQRPADLRPSKPGRPSAPGLPSGLARRCFVAGRVSSISRAEATVATTWITPVTRHGSRNGLERSASSGPHSGIQPYLSHGSAKKPPRSGPNVEPTPHDIVRYTSARPCDTASHDSPIIVFRLPMMPFMRPPKKRAAQAAL
mmetsp:Transcript_818/g.1996  ORF Transcript_818/g.1996 Transcript_818/m.1996 type:complete len:217 (-) Transcript_818:565-1215(-)